MKQNRIISSRSIIPVILSAGDSVRMGSPKALLPLEGGNFLSVILKKLDHLELGVPIVTLGRHADRILPSIPKERITVLINPDPDRGQLSSMKLAIQELPHDASACLFWPVDHPLVSKDLARGLIDLFVTTGAPIVLPCVGRRRGHPAVFSRSIFGELLDLPLEGGAKVLVQKYKEVTELLPTEESAAVEDIDTPDDYRKVIT